MNVIKLGRSKVRVDELLQDAFHNIARRAQAREIRLALRVPAIMSPVYAEKELLRIALDNLLENALRYCAQGGSIEVLRVKHEDEKKIAAAEFAQTGAVKAGSIFGV